MRLLTFAIAAAMPAMSMTTCVDIDHTTVLFSDGSGKFVLALTVKDGKTSSSPDEGLAGILDMCEGVSALSMPILKKHGDVETNTWTIYFQDINKFRINQADGNRENILSHTLSRNGTEGTLVFRNDLIAQWKKKSAQPLNPDETDKSDDYYRFGLILPGKITKVEGWPAPKDRSVEIRIDDRLRFAARKGEEEATKRVAQLSPEMKVTWTDGGTAAKELESFKAELAKAVEEWKKIEPRVRKILEDKKKKD